jgi:hypothetical protein
MDLNQTSRLAQTPEIRLFLRMARGSNLIRSRSSLISQNWSALFPSTLTATTEQSTDFLADALYVPTRSSSST